MSPTTPHHLHRPHRRRVLVAAAAVAIAAPIAACGDDGAQAVKMPSAACDAFTRLASAFIGDPDSAAPHTAVLVAQAPASLRDEATTIAAGFAAASTDQEALSAPAFTAAWNAVGDAAVESCTISSKLEVSGVDYAYSGIPATVKAGRTALRLTNQSKSGEPHELVLARRLPGVDTPVADLLKMPPDQLFGSITMAGVVFVEKAGTHAAALLDLEPGRYIAVCMLPTAGVESDPHAGHGMVTEFEVMA